MADREELRELYDSLSDEELVRLSRGELVAEARSVLLAEMSRRGLAPGVPPAAPEARRSSFSLRNPYLPPAALIADMGSEASISARGLVRLFQGMVIASTAIGVFLWVWPYLPLPISENTLAMRYAGGADALSPAVSEAIFSVLQPVWVVAGLGLFFFLWWGRLLLATAYVFGTIGTLTGGIVIWLPWEASLIAIATVLDGAVLVLAFLPPLSKYFERT